MPTRRGLRLLQCGAVLSEVLDQPGPTHSVVDVIAAAALALHPNPRPHIALLGFAAGGILGPLRAMNYTVPVAAVDVDTRSFKIFRRLCRSWCGQVRFHQAEAAAWLARHPTTYGMIIEDLSIAHHGDVIKPPCVWTTLPRLVSRRLQAGGAAVFNLLRPSESTWSRAIQTVAQPFHGGLQVIFEDFENRLFLAPGGPMSARECSRRMKTLLRAIGSRQADKISVRALRTREFLKS